jgi:hypothetical protein
MGRWIAIGRAPGWDDLKRFSAELKDTNQWRIDPRSTVTSVYALGDGRMVAECHASSQTEFEDWLRKKGWSVESVTPIRFVAKAGDIWKVG